MGNELQRADQGVKGVLKSLFMSDTERANSVNRRITEYNPCSVDAFFEPSRGVYNAVISGGDARLRTNAMVAQAVCAVHNNFPVIVLHEGNRQLESQLRSNFSAIGKYCEISGRNPCFEPFYKLNELEIATQILEVAPKEYDIKFNARYYIEGISSLLKKSGKHLSFKMFSTCPHALLFDKVDELQTQGKISDSEAQEIKSKLMMGQSEAYKLDTLLATLKMEIEPMMYIRKQGYKPCNIISELETNKVLCFDIASVTNQLLMNTIVYQLKLALTRGLSYTIIVDSISTNVNEKYAAYMKSSSDKVCKTIASDDFYAMVGSDEKTFSAAIGESQILIVMGHASGHSATKWADVFGQYDKYEQSYSTSRGASKQTPFSIFSSPNYNRSVNIDKRRDYIVKPENISHMRNGEAYILTMARGEVAHLILTE